MNTNLISKEKFISTIDEMMEVNDIENKVNDLIRNSKNESLRDFGYFNYMSCQDNTILELLSIIFNDDDILSWWIYDLDYGRKYTDGCITESDGSIIDLSTVDKLYDYLTKLKGNKNG